MINRENWLDVKEYLHHHTYALQRSPETIKRKRAYLRHFLEWADRTPFSKANTIAPLFPQYLLSARNDDKQKPLAPTSMKRTCREARSLYAWGMLAHPKKYREVSQLWVASIRPPRAKGEQSVLPERKLFTLEMVRAILALKPQTVKEQRDQAATAFLFLSGMRSGAFVTLPISCVDLEGQRVQQLPEHGVHTKNYKAAVTSLLSLPDLLEVALAWDGYIKSVLPLDAPWYPPLNSDGMQFIGWNEEFREHRRDRFAHGLRHLCRKAGIDYSHPHSLRHGHAVFALKNVKTMAEFKAVSQNLMHNSMSTTDSIYGNMVHDDVHVVITSLGKSHTVTVQDASFLSKLEQVIEIIQENPTMVDAILQLIS